jgi:hypothetical protein
LDQAAASADGVASFKIYQMRKNYNNRSSFYFYFFLFFWIPVSRFFGFFFCATSSNDLEINYNYVQDTQYYM